ncbi:MAG: TetR/AcrR family transcriptional regulator [Cyanobacteria bacterium P01_G01_bin.67]
MNQQRKVFHSRRYDIEGRYAALLDAGEMLLCQSYDYAKPQEIAKSAGVSVGLFYRHFRNKQELLTAIMVKHLNLLHKQIMQQLQPKQEPVIALETVINLTLNYFQKHQGLIKLFFMQIGYGNTAATEQLQAARKNYRIILESIIVRGIAENVFVALDIEIAINSIVGTINWTLYDLLIVNHRDIESKQLTERLLTHILRGLGFKTTHKHIQ